MDAVVPGDMVLEFYCGVGCFYLRHLVFVPRPETALCNADIRVVMVVEQTQRLTPQ